MCEKSADWQSLGSAADARRHRRRHHTQPDTSPSEEGTVDRKYLLGTVQRFTVHRVPFVLEMVTCLTTPHVNIEAYAMRFTSNPTPNPDPFQAPRVGVKGGRNGNSE